MSFKESVSFEIVFCALLIITIAMGIHAHLWIMNDAQARHIDATIEQAYGAGYMSASRACFDITMDHERQSWNSGWGE